MEVLDFLVHGLNSITTVLDLFLGARPFRLLHIYQPIIALCFYLIFSVIYWAAGGTGREGCHWIYPILDWNKPETTVPLIFVMLVGVFVIHGFLWALQLLRDFLHARYFLKKPVSSQNTYENESFHT